MADVTRRIGLSLGADVCWPICYEEMMRRLDLALPVGDDVVRFAVERVTIEPFDLRQPCRYDLVVDRLTHWYTTSREWIKKAVIMDGLYVFNNPWSIQANEKHTSYCAMMALGLPVPDTWMVPPKEYEPRADLDTTLERYAQLFDLGQVGASLGYPMFMKPYDGGGWAGVSRIDDEAGLRTAYEQSGTYLMHLQAAVDPFDLFVRCLGFGPQLRIIRYDPAAALHDRYTADDGGIGDDERSLLTDMTLLINSFFGWDFNSCEALRKDGEWHPIDFANACPDSQVTSLHYHFPWLVAANLRWSIFCAATKRPMRRTLDWAALLRRARGGPAVLASGSPRTPPSRGSDSTPTRSTSSAPPTSATSTRCCGSSSAPTSPRTPSARRSPPCSRRTRSTSSPSCSGPASSGGGPRTRRRRAPHEGADDLVLVARRARRRSSARWGHVRHAGPGVPHRRRGRRGDRALPPRRRGR